MEEKDSSPNKFLLIGVAIGLVLGGVIGFLYSKSTAQPTGEADALNPDLVKSRAEVYINQNLLRPGITAKVGNITMRSGIYELKVDLSDGVENQIVDVFISSDGGLMFVEPPIDMAKPLPTVPPGTQAPSGETKVNARTMIDDDPWAGSKDARVVVVEFSDFQCPACASAYPVVKELKEKYGDQILFVYRDFPIHSIHPRAQKAAEAAQCAFEQDRFWEFHDILFERQNDWANIGVPKFKEYAVELGLDADSFNQCLDSDKYREEVQTDLQEGSHFGVQATPTFFINDKNIRGSAPLSMFEVMIDEELNKAS